MNKRYKQALILLFILVFPSLFYVILSGGSHDIVGLPYYGPKTVNDRGDTVYHEVSKLNALDPLIEGAHHEDFSKKVKVLNFTDAGDEGFRVLEQMQNIAERFEDKGDVILITILIDEAESVPRSQLEKMIDTYGLDARNRIFARLSGISSVQFAREELYVFDETKFDSYRNVIVVLDRENRIRGYYDGLQYVDTKEIREAVKALRFLNYRPVKNNENEGE